MSVSENIPASGATPGAGTQQSVGGESIESSAVDQAQAQSTREPRASGSDYLARVQSDPSFARTEVTKHQSRADQAEASIRAQSEWFGELSRYKEQGFSGNDIASHLTNYSKVLADPRLGAVVNDFLKTGEVSFRGHNNKSQGSAMNDEEEYLTDEQKEIRQLKAELSSIKGEISQNVAYSGQQALRGHFEKIASEMGLSGERFERVKKSLMEQVRAWSGAGDVGKSAIANLQTPQGEETVRVLMQKALPWNEVLEIAGEQYLRQKRARGELTTEGPSSLASSGTEPPPLHQSALDALAYAEANPDRMKDLYDKF